LRRPPRVPRPNLIERRTSRFLREPPSVRTAAGVIVTATAAVVVVGGILMRLLDHEEYSNIWVGMWWALQTVTTVGYGDVTPKHTSGRIVAAFVMLEGIAFLTIIIAAITSTFVARAAEEREAQEEARGETAEQRIEAQLDDLARRLAHVETMLASQGNRKHSRPRWLWSVPRPAREDATRRPGDGSHTPPAARGGGPIEHDPDHD
jgi:voltage-gated potassium channel